MIRVGVVGYGYWGPNIVRNFNIADGAKVAMVCDKNPEVLGRLSANGNGYKVTSDDDQLLQSVDIDAVAIVTPVSTHYRLAKKALENGKHIFVEKPFTSNSGQAMELIELAERKRLKIMVDHTFLFTGAVRRIKELIADRELGDIYYYDSTRVNLGLFQHDVNVVWDLAPHDFSIMCYLIDEKPTAIAAWGRSHVNGLEDVAYITVNFGTNKIAHFSVNWLSPVKVRRTLIGGERKMLVWNDLNADEKLKVYDKGVNVRNKEGIYELLVSYRSGDMWAPKVEATEALKLETQQFIDIVGNGQSTVSDGLIGLEVVRMLEACDESLKNDGKMIKMENAFAH